MTLEELQTTIKEEVGVLLYFSGEHCNVCHDLRPKIAKLFSEKFPQIKQVFLDMEENRDLALHYQAFSLPTMMVFLDGREFATEGRNVSLHQLEQKIQRPYSLMTE